MMTARADFRKVFLLMVLLPLVAVAAKPWPWEGSDLPIDEKLEYGTLSNGIRYVILPWQEPADRLSIQLLVEAGWLQETDRQIGLAHLIEHMAFNGTRNFSAGEMVEYFQRLGMAFGADTNAHTWWRETVYKLELPDTREELLRDGLKLFRDYADGMLLEEEEIRKEKGVVLSELQERDTPGSKAWRAEMQFALPDARLTVNRTMSEMDIVRMAARQDLVDFYEGWYIPEHLVLVAVGDIDPQQLVDLFEEYFADMTAPETSPVAPDPGVIRPVEGTRTGFYSGADLAQTKVAVFRRSPIEQRIETFETGLEQMRLGMANFMLGRRFQRLAREEGSVITQGYGYDYRFLDYVRFTGTAVMTQPQHWEEALALVTSELRRALEFGFTEAELHEARQAILTQLREAAETAQARRSRQMVGELVRAVRDHSVFMDPVQRLERFAPAVEQLTGEEVWEAFRAAWDGDDRLVWVSGDFSKVVDGAFAAAMELQVEAPEARALPQFAYTDFGPAGEVVERVVEEDLETTHLRFANGVRLNLKQTDFEPGRIAVQIGFGEGHFSMPKELPGLDTFASSVFVEGGLGEHDWDTIRALLAERTASVGFGVDSGYFTLSGNTNRADLGFQLQLLTAYLVDPSYRPEARRLFLRQLDGFYNRLASEPRMVLANEGERFLASGDPRFGFADRAEMESRSMEELAQWLAPALQSGYLELAIVGDFADEAEVIELVAATLGALPQREIDYAVDAQGRQVALPQAPVEQTFLFSSSNPFAITTLHWGTVDDTDINTVRRLGILGDILGDRMRVHVREEAGESYSPYAFNRSTSFEDFGYIRAFSGVHPDSIDLVTDLVLEQAAALTIEGTNEDELQRMLEPVKSRVPIQRRTNRYWLSNVLLRSQAQPHRLDWARTYPDFWDTVTVEQINDLAAEFLQPDRAIILHIVPQS